MSDTEKDEYAYPGTRFSQGGFVTGQGQGMTMRDYFAAHVLPHVIANLEDWPEDKSEIEAQAELSYMYADAMMEARK